MRLTDSADEAAWRAEVRQFLQSGLPSNLADASDRAGAREEVPADVRAGLRQLEARSRITVPSASDAFSGWRQKLLAKGWTAPAWPLEYGGAGMSVMQQFILNEEFAEAGAPAQGDRRGLTMVGPTLIVHGSEEQKAQHLSRILRGETAWCQGFSEPGSGSDLASLQTRALRDGDDYVINGQKIWTSDAESATWMFMMARTDPEAPKHRGISYFLLEMSTPGITIQPLISMANEHRFNQVFFDSVRVPGKNMVGEENRGWYVGATTLDFERSGVANAISTRKGVERLIRFAKERTSRGLLRNPRVRLELADRLVEAHVSKMLSYRIVDLQGRGLVPNYEASMGKLYASELSQRIAQTALMIMGLYSVLLDRSSEYSPNRGQYARQYLNAVPSTIAGGTSEVQRNVIAQRGLGLPRD